MNTNETKAKIWNMCIEKGIFNKVKGDDFKKIQDIFEKIIKGYEEVEPGQEIFNKVIDSISFEIYNEGNKSPGQENKIISSVSLENIQKEYNELLNTPIPKQIDFTMNAVTSLNSNTSVNTSMNSNMVQFQNQEQFQDQFQKQIKLEEILMTQNKILIKILETQVKIIETLKK